jgi:hypothetical protein
LILLVAISAGFALESLSASFTMMGTIVKAAIGSAHHHPATAFNSSPPSRITERQAQIEVCLDQCGLTTADLQF